MTRLSGMAPITFCVFLATTAAVAEVPATIHYQGLVLDAQGQPAAGPIDAEIGVWDSASGGVRLYRERHDDVELVNGVYDLSIGSGVVLNGSLDESTFEGPARWLELRIDGETLTPRQPFESVAYALRARTAQAFHGDVLQVDGANGEANVVLGAEENPNQGKVSVHGADGSERAAMEFNGSGAGILAAYGAAGSLNFVVSHLTNQPDRGAWSLRDENGDVKVLGLIDSQGQGRVDVSRADGEVAAYVRATEDGAGVMATFGADDSRNLNAAFSNLQGYPDHGFIAVYDSASNARAGMFVNALGQGEIFADVKDFVVPHPRRPEARIVYASLEGPEVAIYHRGMVRLERGSATIELPEHFTALANPSTRTVQLTPESLQSRGLGFEFVDERTIHVGELGGGTGSYPVHFVVHAVRRGYEGRRPVVDSRSAGIAPAPFSSSQSLAAE